MAILFVAVAGLLSLILAVVSLTYGVINQDVGSALSGMCLLGCYGLLTVMAHSRQRYMVAVGCPNCGNQLTTLSVDKTPAEVRQCSCTNCSFSYSLLDHIGSEPGPRECQHCGHEIPEYHFTENGPLSECPLCGKIANLPPSVVRKGRRQEDDDADEDDEGEDDEDNGETDFGGELDKRY